MNRAGRNRHKPLKVRKIEIWNTVGQQTATKGYATITSIARSIGMQPSTHLKNIIFQMVITDKIEMKIMKSKAGRKFYAFFLANQTLRKIKEDCKIPWSCFGGYGSKRVLPCSTAEEGTFRICPVWYEQNLTLTPITRVKSQSNRAGKIPKNIPEKSEEETEQPF